MTKTASLVDFVEIGRQLDAALDKGPAEFKAVAVSMGIRQRKAYYLVEVYRAFGLLAVPRKRLLAIGWTKLQLISDIVSQKNVMDWLAALETHSTEEIRNAVNGKLPIGPLRCMNLYFRAEDYPLVEAGLIKCGAEKSGKGLHGKEAALVAAMALVLGLG